MAAETVVEKLCSHVAIMAEGSIRVRGTLGEVRGDRSLEDVFLQVVGGRIGTGTELTWL